MVWFRLLIILAVASSLPGCIGLLYGLEGVGAGVSILRNVLDVDTSLTQSHSDKTQILPAH